MENVWNSEEVITDGDVYFQKIIEDIQKAKSFITVEMYIFKYDEIGKKIVEQLINARRRGVNVQMIVDGIGSYDLLGQLDQNFKKSGIRLKIYNPLPFYHPVKKNQKWMSRISILIKRAGNLNRRDHRKIITIDNNTLYLGSFNITSEHTDFHEMPKWRDIGVRVTGEHVLFAVLNFKKIWRLKDYFKFKRKYHLELKLGWKKSPIRLNQTILMREYYYRNTLHKLRNSKSRIWLMTPYFIPKRSFIKAIGLACKRGVDVKILISKESDVKIFKWLHFFYFSYLIKMGASIYLYKDSILHAKNYIVDDFMLVGTTNLNHRSLIHDLEADIVIQGEENKKMIECHFNQLLLGQQQVNADYIKQKPWPDRLLSRLLFLFRYWF